MKLSTWSPAAVIAVALLLAGAADATDAPDIPDQGTRERVADWLDWCNPKWRELAAYGAGPYTLYTGDGMDEFIVHLEETNPPVAAVAREFAKTCISVGQVIDEHGELADGCTMRAGVISESGSKTADVTRNPERYVDPGVRLDDDLRANIRAYLEICVPAYVAALDSTRLDDVPATGPQATAPRASPAQDPKSDPFHGLIALHGSITFSQDDHGAYAWGIAWSFGLSEDATAEAIDQCRAHGGMRCVEVGLSPEACGVLAVGIENGYGTGWGDTTTAAAVDALVQCRAVNDNCRIKVARCSQSKRVGGRGLQYETPAREEAPPEPAQED